MAMPMPCLEVHGLLQTGLSYKQPLLRCGGVRGRKGGEGWGVIATPPLEVLRCEA